MKKNQFDQIIGACVIATGLAFIVHDAHAAVAPAVPDLNLPVMEEEVPSDALPVQEPPTEKKKAAVADKSKGKTRAAAATNRKGKTAKKQSVAETKKQEPVVAQSVETQPVETQPVAAEPTAGTDTLAPVEPPAEDFVPARETEETNPAPKKVLKVVYAPAIDRDPTLSQLDLYEIEMREKARLRAIEEEKQRKIEAEQRRLAELERLRQLELERLRDPSKEIRGRIRINGIIGQEVFIGDKVYAVGGTVLGARIISIQPEEVVFMYKGQKFVKKVQLK